MAVPKKRKSKARVRQVKAGKKRVIYNNIIACPNCGGPTLSHRMCGSCGYYNGRIFNLKINATTDETVESSDDDNTETTESK